MVSSILIILVSVVLLLYWFRYTCVLILKTRGARDYSAEVAAANQLSFPDVVGRLQAGQELDPLRRMLERDCRLLEYLLHHTASLEVGGPTVEQRLLSIDFRLMRLWYAVTRRLASSQARRALEEMSEIVSHFANAMGERAAASVRD